MGLTSEQLEKACRLNRVWSGKIDWPTAPEFIGAGLLPIAGPEFAAAVAAFQAAHGLYPDGILGPKTAAAIRGTTWQPPVGTDTFIKDGARITVPGVKILDFKETGLRFGGNSGLVYKRTEPVVMGVLHTTGGEGSGHQVWNTLVARHLSVDGLVDSDGTFYQYNDPAKNATAHGGWTNPISWGFEMTNDLDPQKGKLRRPIVEGTLRGQPHRWDGLIPVQRDAAVRLITAWCDAFGIPHCIPGRDGKVLDGPPASPELLRDYRAAKRAKNAYVAKKLGDQLVAEIRPLLEGTIVGHFMVSFGGKPDPSPDIFDALLAAGFKIKEV